MPIEIPTLAIPRVASIRGAADGSLCRHDTYHGRDHLVVPVVALVGDTVIYASNAPGPELVLLSEISVSPGGWNGRPVVPGHPTNATGSANEPEWLETQCFGIVFNSRIDDGRLKLDAWLDIARAEEMGGDAHDIVTRCSAGEVVEISVGAYVAAEETSGTWDETGQDYVGIWRYIVPDHLAMLRDGVIGACSVELGCGAPRVAMLKEDGNVSKVNVKTTSASGEPRSMIGRLLTALRAGPVTTAAATTAATTPTTERSAELSNSDLEGRLWEALYAAVPALAYIESVMPTSKTVVYAVYSSADTWYADRNLYQRTYKLSKDDDVSLNDDVATVERTTTYKVVTTATTNTNDQETPTAAAAAAPCACHNKPAAIATAAVTNQEGTTMPNATTTTTTTATTTAATSSLTVQQITDRLLRSAAFKGSNVAALTALGEETLRRLNDALPDEAITAAPVVPDATAPTAAPAAPTATPTVDEWFASPGVPDEIKAMARHYIAQDTARRDHLVATLTAAQKSFSADELRAMSTPHLEKLSGALGTANPAVVTSAPAIDFSGRALPVTSAASAVVPPAPKGISLALAARAGKNSGSINTTATN